MVVVAPVAFKLFYNIIITIYFRNRWTVAVASRERLCVCLCVCVCVCVRERERERVCRKSESMRVGVLVFESVF